MNCRVDPWVVASRSLALSFRPYKNLSLCQIPLLERTSARLPASSPPTQYQGTERIKVAMSKRGDSEQKKMAIYSTSHLRRHFLRSDRTAHLDR
jgi:hypothetical protein